MSIPFDEETREHFDDDALTSRMTEQLRLIWNARGAADISRLEALEVIPDHVSDDALRALDR